MRVAGMARHTGVCVSECVCVYYLNGLWMQLAGKGKASILAPDAQLAAVQKAGRQYTRTQISQYAHMYARAHTHTHTHRDGSRPRVEASPDLPPGFSNGDGHADTSGRSTAHPPSSRSQAPYQDSDLPPGYPLAGPARDVGSRWVHTFLAREHGRGWVHTFLARAQRHCPDVTMPSERRIASSRRRQGQQDMLRDAY